MPPTEVPHPNAKLPSAFKWVTVEPAVFFFALAAGMVSISNANLYFERSCSVGSVWFGNGTSFPDEVCDNITDPLYFHEERFVERQVAKLTYVSAALQAFPAILFTMFAGAWSDSYGRRTILFLPLVGFIARDIVFLIISQIHSAPPEYILFEALQDLTGGLPMLMVGAFAHLSDFTTIKSRTSRMAILEMFYLTGFSIGLAIAVPIFGLGYAPIYILALILVLSGILSLPFFVKKPKIKKIDGRIVDFTYHDETDFDPEDDGLFLSSWRKLKMFFRTKNIKKTASTAFGKRPNGQRHLIWCTLIIFAIIEVVTGLERLVDIVFIRDHLTDEGDFEGLTKWWRTFNAIYTVWGLLCMGVFVPVLKQIYHLSDTIIIMISLCGSILRQLTFMLAEKADNLYIGSFVDLFNLAGIVACRSILVSLVEREEVGRMLAVSAIIQEICNVFIPLGTMLYSATQDTNIYFVYCLNSTLFIMALILTFYVWFDMKRRKLVRWPKSPKKTGKANHGVVEDEVVQRPELDLIR